VRIIALEVPARGVADEDFARLAADEAARLWQLVQAGIVRESWFRVDRHDAVLILEAGSTQEASAALATLPFVQAGLIDFEVIGLRPYPGFARLFARDPG
jgi:muconolactone delta-isomerase